MKGNRPWLEKSLQELRGIEHGGTIPKYQGLVPYQIFTVSAQREYIEDSKYKRTSKLHDWFKSYSDSAEKGDFPPFIFVRAPFRPFTEVLVQHDQLPKRYLTEKY